MTLPLPTGWSRGGGDNGAKTEICGPKCGWAPPFENRAQKQGFCFEREGPKHNLVREFLTLAPLAPSESASAPPPSNINLFQDRPDRLADVNNICKKYVFQTKCAIITCATHKKVYEEWQSAMSRQKQNVTILLTWTVFGETGRIISVSPTNRRRLSDKLLTVSVHRRSMSHPVWWLPDTERASEVLPLQGRHSYHRRLRNAVCFRCQRAILCAKEKRWVYTFMIQYSRL